MSREIRFRGQTRRKGELIINMAGDKCEANWVYGGIFPQNSGGDFAIIYEQTSCEKRVVYADTVDQYIGVDDKNGKEIYEGDIVKRKMFDDYVIGQVVWVDVGFCGFMLKCGNSYYHIGKSEHTGISDCDEVIGNVYENLDFLKEE